MTAKAFTWLQELHRTLLRFTMENPPRPVHDHDLDWLVRRTHMGIEALRADIRKFHARMQVMDAFIRGEKIEERCLNGSFPLNQWHPCELPGWYWDTNDYRVAAKPADDVIARIPQGFTITWEIAQRIARTYRTLGRTLTESEVRELCVF